MIEIVFSSPDMATLQTDAVSLGYVDKNGKMIVAGPTTDGGNFFLNVVGVVYAPTGGTVTDAFGNATPAMAAQPGIWGRLRVNGAAQYVPTFSNAITEYHYDQILGGWTTDGVTLAPSWVGNVGVIA